MSVEVKKEGEGSPQPSDDVKNLKSEMTRKLSNLEATNAKLAETQAALLAQIQALTPKPAPVKEESLSDLMYKDPDAYARKVAENATNAAQSLVKTHTEQQAKQAQMISSLVADYPELEQGDHEFTKAAVAKFNSLPESDRSSPLAYRTAVLEAAQEAGAASSSRDIASSSALVLRLARSVPASGSE